MHKRKWIHKSLLALISLLLILNVSSAGAVRTGDYGGYEYPETHDLAYDNPDWMSEIPNDRRLSELSIPGTHESMAWNMGIGGVADCQHVWLENQLRSGVRAIDIRLAREFMSDDLLVFHGWITQYADFNEVLIEVVKFLVEHPKETVLMRIQETDAGIKLDPGDFERRVKKYFEERKYEPKGLKYSNWLWVPTSDNPELGEVDGEGVRGKIVILDEFGTHVTGEWVDIGYEDADVGQFSSLALDRDDQPHISYYDATQKALIYAHREGSDPWSFDTVDSAGDVGLYTSLALDENNRPHISYYDADNDDLKYAFWTGEFWWFAPVDGGSVNDVGQYSSIALDDADHPHISYYDAHSGDLNYAVGKDWKGYEQGWDWRIIQVDTGSGNNVGQYSSLALDASGYPHFSYYDETDDDLKYAFWDNISGWNYQFVDHGPKNDVGLFTSLALHGDLVHISYYDANEGNLNYVYKERNWDFWVYQTVDNVEDVGQFSSLALDGEGKPHISYYEATSGNLKYAGPSHVCIEGDSRVTEFGLKYGGACQLIQDDYDLDNPWDLIGRKWPQVATHLLKADEGGRDRFYMNYLSASGGSSSTHPFFYASGHTDKATDSIHKNTGRYCSIMDGECDDWYPWPYGNCDENGKCTVYYTGTNELTTLHLSKNPPRLRPRRWGIIWADFPGGVLIDAIIKANFPQPLLYLPAILK